MSSVYTASAPIKAVPVSACEGGNGTVNTSSHKDSYWKRQQIKERKKLAKAEAKKLRAESTQPKSLAKKARDWFGQLGHKNKVSPKHAKEVAVGQVKGEHPAHDETAVCMENKLTHVIPAAKKARFESGSKSVHCSVPAYLPSVCPTNLPRGPNRPHLARLSPASSFDSTSSSTSPTSTLVGTPTFASTTFTSSYSNASEGAWIKGLGIENVTESEWPASARADAF